VAGDTSATTRDIIQVKLLGDTAGGNNIGTGLIPGKRIDKVVPRPGIPGAAESALVRWGKNGQSRLKFRSYEQGRKIFQGTEEDIIWLDEEVPEDVYAEALIRTMTTDGILLMTFTPLQGLTPLVASFLGYDGAAA
jgi:phage terminase large subunit-like protein